MTQPQPTVADRAYDVITEVRDRYPRRPGDAPSEEIVDALQKAVLLIPEPTIPRLIAELPSVTDSSYSLVREYRIGDYSVRISVRRQQSALAFSPAVAEVLLADLTWAMLTSTPESLWRDSKPWAVQTHQEVVDALDDIAVALLERAVAILPGGESR